MSIIAYDGTFIAADRRGTQGGAARIMPKLFEIKGYAVGYVGDVEAGQLLVQWFVEGAHAGQWPEKAQDDDDNRALLVVGSRHGVWTYCQYPVKCVVNDPFWAWGCGRPIAIGALAMGADAVRAVEVTCQFDVYCGNGVDVFRLADMPGDGRRPHKKRK